METRYPVLIVDDDPDWAQILVSLLRELDFECLIASTYIDAIKLIKRNFPFVVILDLNLGNGNLHSSDWDGWQLAAAAKERNISSVILTGYPQDYNFGRAFREFGAIDVFDKQNFSDRKSVFIQRVHEAIEKTKSLQKIESSEEMPLKMLRNSVFISYSHKDKKWLDKFSINLKTLERNKLLKTWDDTKIKVGANWKNEINKALSSSKVAILLVTPDFLASDFIYEKELSPLLKVANKDGLKVIWVAVRPSLYEDTELVDFQAANDPSKPLSVLTDSDAELEIVEICKKVKEIMQN